MRDDGLDPDVSIVYILRLQHLQGSRLSRRTRGVSGSHWATPRCERQAPSEEKPEMTLPSFPNIDLFSAGINALNGVLVARNPSHNRGYTAAGLLIMAFFGGIGGGGSPDVLLNYIPSPFRSPIYLFVCVLIGFLGLAIFRFLESREERVRTEKL